MSYFFEVTADITRRKGIIWVLVCYIVGIWEVVFDCDESMSVPQDGHGWSLAMKCPSVAYLKVFDYIHQPFQVTMVGSGQGSTDKQISLSVSICLYLVNFNNLE